jgi:ankyrin repeat protein
MDARELPAQPDLEQYKTQAKELVRAYKGDRQALQKINGRYRPERDFSAEELREKMQQRLQKFNRSKLESDKFSLADAQFLLARDYGFDSWPKFAKHVANLSHINSPISKFEQGVEAIITGDEKTLRRLLGEDPKLIRERSGRIHGATLLHYVGANGVEDYRQKTPPNAAEIAKILLDAGAEVDSMAWMYGGSTTLGLIATSIHPQQAGVQNELMEIFLRAGAKIDHPKAGGNEMNAVNGCLANGRGAAAEYLAERGAKLDLEGAAGVGKLNLVKRFFDKDGKLTNGATPLQLERGFGWACEYGRSEVVEFILDTGFDIQAGEKTGLTGLHWAVVGAQVDTVKLLLKHGASLTALNCYGGDALSQALWHLPNSEPAAQYLPVLETLLEAGAAIEEGTIAWLWKQPKPADEIKAKAEEILKRFGAVS